MTITQLNYALAVNNYRHFGKAAESCHVTQPTLSMQVQKLEDELGIILFDRHKHPVEPTEAGKHLLLQAERILSEVEGMHAMVEELKGELKGEFRLAIIPTLAPTVLYRLVPKLQRFLPDVDFRIQEMQTEQIIAALRNRDLDGAILATPLDENDLEEYPVFYEPFMAYVPEGHRLEKESFILHSELDSRDMLLLNEGHCFRNSVLKLCKDPEGHPSSMKKIEIESGNFDTLIRLSRLGYGMTLLPYLTAADLAKEQQKFLKPLDNPIPTRMISVVCLQSHYKKRMAKVLVEALSACIPDRLKEEKHSIIKPF